MRDRCGADDRAHGPGEAAGAAELLRHPWVRAQPVGPLLTAAAHGLLPDGLLSVYRQSAVGHAGAGRARPVGLGRSARMRDAARLVVRR